MAKHFAIVQSEDNSVNQHLLKTYIRQNREQYSDLDPDIKTTGHIRRKLINQGWIKQSSEDKVFLIKPDTDGSVEYASQIIDLIDDELDELEDFKEDLIEISFGLEKDLQNALRKNIQSLGYNLSIIDGGVEKTTEAGRIDITTQDADGTIVVIELKAGTAKSDVIAQTLSYMTALKREGHKSVKGIIIANSFQDRVKLAAEQIENLELIEYSFQFSFKSIK